MNTPAPVAATPKRRRLWPWVVGVVLTPFLFLGFAILSFVTLNSEAATLRGHVMAATHADWNTRVQISVGRLTLGTLRTCLAFVPDIDADARLAFSTVRHASVGVYELADETINWSREELFVDTDKAMHRRGWSRLVGVAEQKNTVLVYVADDADLGGSSVDICLAVVDGRDLIVASASIDGESLMKLVHSQTHGDRKHKFSSLRL